MRKLFVHQADERALLRLGDQLNARVGSPLPGARGPGHHTATHLLQRRSSRCGPRDQPGVSAGGFDRLRFDFHARAAAQPRGVGADRDLINAGSEARHAMEVQEMAPEAGQAAEAVGHVRREYDATGDGWWTCPVVSMELCGRHPRGPTRRDRSVQDSGESGVAAAPPGSAVPARRCLPTSTPGEQVVRRPVASVFKARPGEGCGAG